MKFVISFGIIFSILFAGCNYLDMVPEDDIETVETIFEKREQAEQWLKDCYYRLREPIASVIANPAYLGADEVVAGEHARRRAGTGKTNWSGLFIGDGLQMVQDPYGNIWSDQTYYLGIRYCNIFLENIGHTYSMQESEKALWSAEIKALKAHFYFELFRRYGAIVLVPENIDVNVEISEMQQPRSPVDSCVNAIVRLLDEAMEVLPPMGQKEQIRWGYHSLESAATLKAYTLLYAASPLFNGNPAYTNFKNKNGELLFNPEYDKEKWRIAAEAAEEALEICLENGKEFVRGNTGATPLLATMKDIERSSLAQNWVNNEAIFMMRQQDMGNNGWSFWTLPYLKSTDPMYGSSAGCLGASLNMVEMYYTENGLPIDADNTWNHAYRYQMSREVNPKYRDVVALNTNVLGLHLRREPRFYAHVAADQCYFRLGTTVNHNMLVEAYQGARFGTQEEIINSNVPQNLSGYWIKKGLYSDVPLTNYFNSVSGREEPFVVFRLADLYLMIAEAWNEYLDAPDEEHVYQYIDAVRERAGIPDVVTAWTTYSNNPGKVTTQEGMREIIHREWDVEFAFEARRFWNLRRWLDAEEVLNADLLGWNILGSDADAFYNHYEGPVPVWTKRGFTAPRDYLFPIRSEEILISGCVQNPGW